MRKKFLLVLGTIIAIITVLVLTLTQVPAVRSEPGTSTPTPTHALTPVDPSLLPEKPTAVQPDVVDLALHIPCEGKPSVVVQHPDSSRTMYLLAPDELDSFVNSLPAGT
jgi:hypothetical protein